MRVTMQYIDIPEWDVTNKPDYDNIKRILKGMGDILIDGNRGIFPSDVYEALEALLEVAYPTPCETFYCEVCGAAIEMPTKMVGRKRRYCSRYDCQKEAQRRRVAEHRANKKQNNPKTKAPEGNSPSGKRPEEKP